MLTARTLPAGNKPFTQSFDSQGRATTQTDSRGNATAIGFDTPSGGATKVTEPIAASYQVTHQTGNFTALVDSLGQTASFAYDSANRRTSVTDRFGDTSTATYDTASGLPASYTDALGNTTSFTYAPQSQGPFTFYNLTQVRYPDGASAGMTHDASGNVLTFTDRAGKQVAHTYNQQGLPLTVTNPAGGATTYSYNADGTVASVKLNSGDTTTFTYDNRKRLAQITQPDGKTRRFSYDNRDSLLQVTDERGNTATLAYTDNNELKSATDAFGNTASSSYTTDERLAALTDPLGKTSTFAYDALNRLQSATAATGDVFRYGYDALDRLTSVTDAGGKGAGIAYDKEGVAASFTDGQNRTWTFTSDKLGRITRTASPLGENVDQAYDKLGRVASITNPLLQTASVSYDSRSLVSSLLLPAGISASYTRNDLGLVTGVADPNGNSWAFNWDSMGRLSSESDPLSRVTSFAYDSRQRVSRITLPSGAVQFNYDEAGNLTGRAYSDGTNLSYTYDKDNRLTAAGGIALAYDARGGVTSSNGLTVARDDAGRIASITYAAGKTVTYTYNNRGLLSQLADWAGGSTSFAYDGARQMVSITRPNGVVTQFSYDGAGRLSGITESKGGNLSSITLQHDGAGQVTSTDRNVPTSPDPAAGALPLAYDAADQVQGYTYDQLGRVTRDGLHTYTWDLGSRLTGYSGSDGSASFNYDALGMRIAKTSGGATENYVINYALGLPAVSIVRAGSSDVRYYVYMPGGALLYSVEAADGKRHFYHFDEAGSTLFLTDDGGSVSDSYGVTPYGETITASGSTPNPFTFLGAYGVMQEGTTGLYYMRARYYDSTTARFLSPDPVLSLDPGGVNPYQYALANPLLLSDPLGLTPGAGSPCDVPAPSPYFSFIQKMRELRITNGCPGAGSATLTRGQMAVFLIRAQLGTLAEPGQPSAGASVTGGTRLKALFNNIPAQTQIYVNGVQAPTGDGGTIVIQSFSFNGASVPSPTIGTATVNGSYAPISTASGAASSSLPVPRFADTTSATNSFQVYVAPTNLLFPFVTNQAGFDTGLAIANTSAVPFGTTPQTGACTLNFYGPTAPFVTGPLNSNAAPGFQGYTIAVCNFQYAHGFAYISDIGARNLAMGYLALVNSGR